MKANSCTIASVATLMIFLLVPTQSRKSHHAKGAKHAEEESHLKRISDKESLIDSMRDRDFLNHLSKDEEQVECHKASLHKCGLTFLKAHKLLSFLSDEIASFKTKCGLRTAFFNCLKQMREKICKHRYLTRYDHDPEFLKKMTDALWSTRVCVLGINYATAS